MTAQKASLSFLLILSALMAFTSLSTDVYLPAMPTMERQLNGNAELPSALVQLRTCAKGS